MIYYTFNPRIMDDPLSVRYAARDTTLFAPQGHPLPAIPPAHDWGAQTGFPDYAARSKLIRENPVEAARGFDRICRAVVELLIGLKLRESHFGRNATQVRASEQPRGIFLRSKALYGVKEADGRDSLHAHNLISTELDPRVLQQYLHDPEFQRELAAVLSSMLVAYVNGDVAAASLLAEVIPRVGLRTAPANASEVAALASYAQAAISRHQHTYSCRKDQSARKQSRRRQPGRVLPSGQQHKNKVCRYAKPQALSDEHMFVQLADFAVRDTFPSFVISPPPPRPLPAELFRDPVGNRDKRVLARIMKRPPIVAGDDLRFRKKDAPPVEGVYRAGSLPPPDVHT